MATPFDVPLPKSSNLDCSHVRVPSAKSRDEKNVTRKIVRKSRKRAGKDCTSIQDMELRYDVAGSSPVPIPPVRPLLTSILQLFHDVFAHLQTISGVRAWFFCVL